MSKPEPTPGDGKLVSAKTGQSMATGTVRAKRGFYRDGDTYTAFLRNKDGDVHKHCCRSAKDAIRFMYTREERLQAAKIEGEMS